MRRGSVAIVSLLLALLAAVVPARAAGPVFVSAPGSYLTTWLPVPAAAAQVGGALTYVNADAAPHNVVSLCGPTNPQECGPDTAPWCEAVPYPIGKCPRIWSAYAFLGQTVPVLGLNALTAGTTYDFYCELHPAMKGTLVALPAA